MQITEITIQTKSMIDSLKTICSNYGLGNASSEYKIITEIFLYKFLNDKFIFEARQLDSQFSDLTSADIEIKLNEMSEDDYELFLMDFKPDTARLQKEHFISHLFNHKNDDDFNTLFDTTLLDIANLNIDIFSVRAGTEAKMRLFSGISQYIIEHDKKMMFCRAMIDKLANCSFESIFELKYDFFSTIFEYLIKDYNKDFGKYAEYYTPHTIASIIAKIMIPNGDKNVTVYDPAAGSGTLVLALAHEIGEENCTIYTQDISQKSNEFLRLNLILNNLVHSLPHVIHGDTLVAPAHLNSAKNNLMKFDYIVSNPPFKTDFSDNKNELDGDAHKKRFFAGVPNIPNAKKESMAIYLMFLQHIIYSLDDSKGKAAIVVPTGFLTASSGIEKKIREHLISEEMLRGVISMPSNIFATTGTNVSILFIDKTNKGGDVLLMDASKLGTSVKEDKNKKTVLSPQEIDKIITTFTDKKAVEDFSVLISYDDIKDKKYSFSAGQYFEVKTEYVDLTQEEFTDKMDTFTGNLTTYFAESEKLQNEITEQLKTVKYE